jgi:hypothetical protein
VRKAMTMTWTLRAAGLVLPLVCAAGAQALPAGDGDFCTEEQVQRTVQSNSFDGESAGTCHYTCQVTDRIRWTCWVWEREPLPYSTAAPRLQAIPTRSAAPGLEPFTAAPGAKACALVPVSTGDSSDSYTIPKDKPKGAEGCPGPDSTMCCEDWGGACSSY